MKNKYIYYVHIDKTAGTTFHEILRNNFLFHYITSDKDKNLTAHELFQMKKFIPSFKSFGGHNVVFYEDYDKLDGDFYGVTFLRDPVKRSISEYFHYKRTDKDLTFDDFLKMNNWPNRMCKKISGTGSFEKCKHILDNKNVCVLITEYFDYSLLYLKEYVETNNIKNNFCINYAKENVASNDAKEEKEKIIQKYYQDILNLNQEDMKLYEYYKAEFEAKVIGGYTNEKLKEFVFYNDGYEFNKFIIFIMKIFRKMYIANIEKLIRR